MSTYQLPHWVYPTVVLATTVLVCTRGGRDEKIAHGAWTVGWILSMMNYRYGNDPQWAIMPIDCAILVVTTFVALRSERYWPLFTAGFSLLLVGTHVAKIVDPTISGWAYLSCGILWSYLAVFSIAYGAWSATSREVDAPDQAPETAPAFGLAPVAAAAMHTALRPAEVAAATRAPQPVRRRAPTQKPAHEPA